MNITSGYNTTFNTVELEYTKSMILFYVLTGIPVILGLFVLIGTIIMLIIRCCKQEDVGNKKSCFDLYNRLILQRNSLTINSPYEAGERLSLVS